MLGGANCGGGSGSGRCNVFLVWWRWWVVLVVVVAAAMSFWCGDVKWG